MFSVPSGKREPKTCEVHRWWCQPEGLLLIKYVSSLQKITPSLADTTVENIQLPECGPVENINPLHSPADRFMDTNNHLLFNFRFPEITDLCDQREIKGLPATLLSNLMLNRIFPENFETSDLSNKLTGLDYLSNLESARCAALREAARRLNVSEQSWREVLGHCKEAQSWILHILNMERQIEHLYAISWYGLRTWSMVKELQDEPFYKPTALAMLNTLFPPALGELPAVRVTPDVMWNTRSCLYQYLISTEVNGKTAIDPFIKKLSQPGSPRSWPLIRQSLKEYIIIADLMISQAESVYGVSFFYGHDDDSSLSKSRHASTATTISTLSNDLTRETSKTSDEQKILPSMVDNKKFIAIPRSRISGRHIYNTQNFSTLSVNSETASKDAPSSPRRSGPQHLSMASDQSSINKDDGYIRIRRSTTPRTSTPSLETSEYVYPPSNKIRLSQEIRNMLPRTPDPLNPPPTFGKKLVAKTSMIFKSRGPDDHEQLPVQSPEPTTIPKKSALGIFGRKKTEIVLPEPVVPGYVDQFEESKSQTSHSTIDFKGKDRQDATNASVVIMPGLKTKSSFGFLRRRKSRDEVRTVSESNSDRIITDATTPANTATPTDVKLKNKRSISSLFARRQARMSLMSYTGVECEIPAPDDGDIFDDKKIRKARSYDSVKSSSLSTPHGRDKSIANFAPSADTDEDRIYTSADIIDPYPFASSSQPYVRAPGERNLLPLLSRLQASKFTEKERDALLEAARLERVEEARYNKEFLKRFDIAEQKRLEGRKNMDSNTRKTPNKIMGLFRKTKDAQTPSRSDQNSTTLDPQTPGSEKTRTSVGHWLLKEMSTSYSPKSQL